MLCNLIYFSERSFACPDSEVEHIVQESSERNQKRDVTGFLVAGSAFFLQMIEGERKALSVLYDLIQADLRHSDIVLASFTETTERLFPNWGMAQIGDPKLIQAAAAELVGDAPLKPETMSAADLRRLIIEAARLSHR